MILILIVAIKISAQISPGDLSNAHKDYEGISNCTKCHELGEDVINDKCLDCHKEIKTQLQRNKGYHSDSGIKSKKCYQCHSEHHGREFNLIKFDKKNFNHSSTGFELTGRHQQIECGDCHNSKFSEIDDKENTFLGLNNNCKSCHEDVHLKTLGDNCAKCHSTKSFKPPEYFNHNNTRFILTGAHTNVNCVECHKIETKNDHKFQHFADIKFNSCSSCHKDVHQNKFGSNCESCHQTSSFSLLKKTNNFDHSKTNYQLIGKHQFLKCNECHKGKLTQNLKHDRCTDCHKDYHQGQFLVNGNNKDCNECHNLNGFSPSDYSIDNHNRLNFRLLGSHLAVPCQDCHLENEKWNFRIKSESCIDCHENIHKNEIAAKYIGSPACVSCHSFAAWSSISFNHLLTDFKLEGKHSLIKCRDCHFKETADSVIQKFESLKSNCEECHNDVHKGQFVKNGITDCSNCHGFENWQASKFDHSLTRFPLDGAHSKVACVKCHKASGDAGYILFKYSGEIKCITCHT